jgi:hypothetical protein
MKLNKIKSSQKFSYTFARLSMCMGYLISLSAVFLFAVENDPKGINLIPVAQLFFEGAKISMHLEREMKKPNKLLNKN